jgi:glutamate-1-semialdehyde 2,1-aminomutase
MAAGIAALEKLRSENPYPHLESYGEQIRDALLGTAKEKGLPLQVPQTGSMFSLYFSETPVTNYEEAIATETAHFKSVFHHALKNGVYLPPSPFETCFISSAHEGNAINMACDVLSEAIKNL